jgi:hypothetical protein
VDEREFFGLQSYTRKHKSRPERSFGWLFWSWIRGRDPEPRARDEVVRLVRRREFGDVNISTLLSLAVLGGLLLVAPLG